MIADGLNDVIPNVNLLLPLTEIGAAPVPTGVAYAALAAGRLGCILPEWRTAPSILHLAFPSRRDVLPGARVLIDRISRALLQRFRPSRLMEARVRRTKRSPRTSILFTRGLKIRVAAKLARSELKEVQAVETFEYANDTMLAKEYNALVLDLMLPKGSSLDILNRVRLSGRMKPILLLTARDGVRDQIAEMDGDGDPNRPFDLGEVGARLRALTPRGAGEARGIVERDGLRLDPSTLSVEKYGEPVRLSRREFVILHALMLHRGAVLSRSHLKNKLYGQQEEVESNAVEVHIHRLRAKLGVQIVRTIRGASYIFGAAGP